MKVYFVKSVDVIELLSLIIKILKSGTIKSISVTNQYILLGFEANTSWSLISVPFLGFLNSENCLTDRKPQNFQEYSYYSNRKPKAIASFTRMLTRHWYGISSVCTEHMLHSERDTKTEMAFPFKPLLLLFLMAQMQRQNKQQQQQQKTHLHIITTMLHKTKTIRAN